MCAYRKHITALSARPQTDSCAITKSCTQTAPSAELSASRIRTRALCRCPTLTRRTWPLLAASVLTLLALLSHAHSAAARSTTTISTAASTTISYPVAAPLLGSAAAAAALLNSSRTAAGARQHLSLETNSIQRQIEVSSGGGGGAGDHSRSLKRVYLSNRTITCNDRSQAGFYLRKNPSSKKWVVFLEGGWHCYDTRSCRARWLRLRHLMTSTQWPETRDVGGILSPLAAENPYWHNANHVLVPYCSSDSWSGTRASAESRDNNWRFMGALILRQVVADLIPLGLGRTNANGGAELLLVGSSAGGLGVMLNLDRITNFLLHERGLAVTVRGVSDSGWFLDREPYTPSAVASSEAVRQGWKLWQGLLPEDCTRRHEAEPWRCYFGYRLYPTLTSPLFVFQWLFDEAQMRADNVGAPVTPQQWNYIHEMGGALRSSLDNVTAVFAPSCIGHAVLSKRDWLNIKIDDISLPAALRCWEHSTRPRRKRHDKLKRSTEATTLLQQQQQHQHQQQQQRKRHHRNQNQRHPKQHQRHNDANADNNQPPNSRPRLTKAEREERKRLRHENQQRRREQRRNRRNRKQQHAIAASAGNDGHEPNEPPFQHRQQPGLNHKRNHNNNNRDEANPNAKRMRQGHKQHRKQQPQAAATAQSAAAAGQDQQQRQLENREREPQQEQQPLSADDMQQQQKKRSSNNANNNNNNNRRNRVPRVPERCALRLLERCSWPQCNHSCPTLTNPLTGEEMRFLELLTSFGLDIEAVAAALGVDMHTLNNMDRTELVNLLTQQVS